MISRGLCYPEFAGCSESEVETDLYGCCGGVRADTINQVRRFLATGARASGASELALPPLVEGQCEAGQIQRRDNQQTFIGDGFATAEQTACCVDHGDVAENDGPLACKSKHARTLAFR